MLLNVSGPFVFVLENLRCVRLDISFDLERTKSLNQSYKLVMYGSLKESLLSKQFLDSG